MPWRLTFRLFSALLVFFCLIENAGAQTTISGALAGIVTDPSGAVVPGADILIRDKAKGTRQFTKTDRDGTYQFSFLLPGQYSLTVSHTGFRAQSCDVEVLLGPPGTRNLTLEIEGGSSTVKVTGEMPLLQTENGDASTTMTAMQVAEVPNPGNDLTYIAQTAPGAIMNTDTSGSGGSYLGNVSILGMPGTSNLFTLNGMNDNMMFVNSNNSGALGMMLGQNEVQEASVVNNGYSAQFGGAAGSSINYVTKSGGNAFHGNAAWYWNGRVLNANDWIDNAESNPRPFDIANQWAGSLGGPIVKDKLFFFFDTEGMHLVLPQPEYVTLPSAAFEAATMKNIDAIFGATSASHKFYRKIFDLYNQTPGASKATPGAFGNSPLGCNGWTNPNDPNDPMALGVGTPCAVHFFENLYHPESESIVSGRVDWNLGPNDRLFFLAQYDHGERAAWIDPINSAFNGFIHMPWWQGQLSETHILSPTASNQFLLAGTYISQNQSVANPAQAQALFPTALGWCYAGCAFTNLGGLAWAEAMLFYVKSVSFQVSDDFTKTSGKHKLGTGVSFLRTYLMGPGYSFSGTGQILPQSINAFFYGGMAPGNPQDITTLVQTFPLNTRNRIAIYSLAPYAQDEWRVRSNLTLTMGLRAEHQSNPVCASSCFSRPVNSFNLLDHDPNQPYNQAILAHQKRAFANIDNIVWSPRFSFAWQPRGTSHQSVLRGGIGIFYDPVPGLLATTQTTSFPLVNTYTIAGYNLAPGEKNNLFDAAVQSNAALLNGFASGQTLAQLRAADPTFSPPAVYNAPHDVHLAQYQKWSLQAQQNFGSSTSLTVGYFGNHGIREFTQDGAANAHNFGTYPSVPCGSPPVAPCYDARFGQVQQYWSNGLSNYNGMVVSFEKRITHWGSGLLQVNYTYGHALDEVSNGGLGQFTYAS